MRKLVYKTESKEISYILQKDPKLKPLFQHHKEIVVNLSDNYFLSLVQTIIAQQLSSKVATVIYNRLDDFFNHEITASKIDQSSEEDLRSLGLSRQKITYLKSLSISVLENIIQLDDLDHLSNQEIIDMLIKIKGIGVWSAQMFLMFSLGREDVFSVLDLGLRNALKKVYQDESLTHQQMEVISELWSPYRSIVCHYLWHAWDNVS